jgi:Fe-S cluster assembly protein SufD
MTNQYSAAYAKLENSLAGSSLAWLNDIRAQAKEQFIEQGFPSLRDEEWRYSNLAVLDKKSFAPVLASELGHIDVADLEAYKLNDCWTMVLVDGHYSAGLSDLQGIPDSVTISSLAEALTDKPDTIKRYLGQATNIKEPGFSAFNQAWFTGGVFVHVAAKAILDKPLQILHLVTGAEVLANTHHLIVLEASAEASIIETFLGCEEQYATVSVTEVFVEKNAGLNLYKTQLESDKAVHLGGVYVKQARDSRFNHHNFSFGAVLARTDVHTDLGQAAECDLNGLYLGVKRQHIDNHTRINHVEPYAISKELYKGVLNDKSRGVFQGRVLVAEQAQKTDSDMHNHNLLLSDNAEADTKPQLEIYADDVKCAHGITVGQLDNQAIFALQARGIDEVSAKNMLTFAFANEMVNKIKFKPLHDQILMQVLNRFPQAGIDQAWL